MPKDDRSETTEQAIQSAIDLRIEKIQHYSTVIVALKSKRAEMGDSGEDCINHFRYFIQKIEKEIALLQSVLR